MVDLSKYAIQFDELKEALAQINPNLKFISLEEIDSTNSHAKKLVSDGVSDNLLIVARRQSKGRGRFERKWECSNELGISATLVIRNSSNPQHLIRAICLSILTALKKAGAQKVSIKWPNDVLLNNRKVAGILAESAKDGKGSDVLILGFGVNINHLEENFSADTRGIATSLRIDIKRPFNCTDILHSIMSKFIRQADNIEETFKSYKKYLSTLHKHCLIDEGRRIYVKDILNDGGLLVSNDGNEEEILYSGTLKYMNQQDQ